MINQDQSVVRRPFLNGGGNQDDILRLLDDLEDLAENGTSFFGKAWGLDLEEFHMLINKVRASLPDEVRSQPGRQRQRQDRPRSQRRSRHDQRAGCRGK